MTSTVGATTTLYCYDRNGNMTRRDPSGAAVDNFQYDAESRLTAVSGSATASFIFDGDGNRVKSTVGGVTTVHIGAYFEWTGSTSTMKKYYSAGGMRIAMRTGASTLYFILSDHLGSTSVATDSNGAFPTDNRFKAWGESRYASGTLPTKFTYTGQYSNVADFGLMYYGARWYDSSLGRFLSADTIIPQPGNPQAWDRYAYSYDNPVKYIDPDGHWPCSFSSSGFSCSVSTFGLGASLDRFGNRLGVENASDIVSEAASNIGLVLDILAEVTDVAASAIVTAGIIVGATGGAAITLPGGGTAVVTGAAGASVGWATAEMGVRPMILAGNIMASTATVATVSSELISGDTGLEAAIGVSTEGVELNSQVTIGPASQVSTFATTAGWISPLAYPSLGVQTIAVLGDLGVISPPPINIRLDASTRKREFRLKRGEVEIR